MTISEIQACHERATEVLNGFKQPSERNARDVVALIRHINGSTKQSKESEDFQAVKDLFGLS